MYTAGTFGPWCGAIVPGTAFCGMPVFEITTPPMGSCFARGATLGEGASGMMSWNLHCGIGQDLLWKLLIKNNSEIGHLKMHRTNMDPIKNLTPGESGAPGRHTQSSTHNNHQSMHRQKNDSQGAVGPALSTWRHHIYADVDRARPEHVQQSSIHASTKN